MRVFNIDISRKGISPVVQVTEYDAMSRFFTLILRDGTEDYEEPEDATYSVWYKTKDSHGWYDTITLPDESTRPAVVADGNAYTIEIAEQATTSCGELALCITAPGGYQLTISGIITRSADIPGYDGSEVENYYNVYITEMRENAARAENAADIAVAYGATVEVDEEAQQLNITHHSDTEGGVGWLFGSAIMTDAEGSVAAFSDGADDVAVKSLVATINPVQSGSGDPSPSNVRAISGRTGMTVTRAGKNLLNNTAQTVTQSGVTFTVNDDGTVSTSGTSTKNANYIVLGVQTLPAGDYVLTGCPSGGSASSFYIRINRGSTASGAAGVRVATDIGSGAAFTLTETTEICIWMSCDNGQVMNDKVFRPMIRPATITDDTYEPYTATTYPITWQTEAGTIYGGTLDVVSGVLTVTAEYLELPASMWTVWNNTDKAAFTDAAYLGRNIITCDSLKPDSTGIYVRGVDGRIRAIAPWAASCTNITEFRTVLANNPPINVVISLATPQTYQLTPTEVKTLLGGNTIYTDAGEVSVEYVADTKLYIDNKVAELQALILEN